MFVSHSFSSTFLSLPNFFVLTYCCFQRSQSTDFHPLDEKQESEVAQMEPVVTGIQSKHPAYPRKR